MWPQIKEKFPDAKLEIAYGWDLFDTVTVGNAERLAWKEKVISLMNQPDITEHGRIGKEALRELRHTCGILAYCSDFTEIFCISVMEAQAAGCIPLTTDIGALAETNQGGIIVKGDIYNTIVQEAYKEKLLLLMGLPKRDYHTLQERGRLAAKNHIWPIIADKWVATFEEQQLEDVKVTIMTPTIRKGFWNIMADTIKNQTYHNIEWLIVDDYPMDREHIAMEYAEEYNLNIRYVRGKKRKVKRPYALVNANNTGLQNATGELLVILQDFILLPTTGIADLVTLYRKNPNCLLAPVDRYYQPKIQPDIESEDWFHGELDIVGKFLWANSRLAQKGLRKSTNAFDFEQNYGAIPMKIARELGGWWEFMDEGLGFDNTQFAYAALTAGYEILIDETNVATCIDHWDALKKKDEKGQMERGRRLNDPRFLWYMQMIQEKRLPLQRDQALDDKIALLYDLPEGITGDAIVAWLREHNDTIVAKWLMEVQV
jgi:hypothetical protein